MSPTPEDEKEPIRSKSHHAFWMKLLVLAQNTQKYVTQSPSISSVFWGAALEKGRFETSTQGSDGEVGVR
jgi:hypothetical protein